VAANLSVLGSETDDTRLGTLSARSIAPDAAPVPTPARIDDDDDDQATGKEDDEEEERRDEHDDEADD